MWYNFKVEFQRYFNEMFNFKFNLFFANVGLILFFNGLLKYTNIIQKESVLILLFFWYFATHGFVNINFIIEEEIMDNTFAHVLMTNTSFLTVVFLRCFIQVIYDLLKAIIVFGVVLLVGNYDFRWLNYSNIILICILMILSICISYFIGLIIGALSLKHKKVSAVAGLFYYFVLFFGGIVYDVSHIFLLNNICYLLPFLPFKQIVVAFQLGFQINYLDIIVLLCQFGLYFILGIAIYNKYLQTILKEGSVFYV